MEPKYADDVTWASTSLIRIEHIKHTIPDKLKSRDLIINESKTEEYSISKTSNPEWKKCKILGTILDTEKDINRRKILAIDALKCITDITKSSKISESLKIRTFNAYVASIFLYNSETWTLSLTLQNNIDAFQRKLLRQSLNIIWPNKISNVELYNRTKQSPWSIIIKRRRLNWLGHLPRLDPNTPVQKALAEALKPVKKTKR